MRDSVPDRAKRLKAYRLGLSAETVAAWMLRLKGYRVIALRYRTKAGEIDLVARRGSVLAFVEVKARATAEAGLFAVDARAQARIARAADVFIARHPRLAGLDRRFDIVVVAPRALPRHLPAAFEAAG